MCHKPAILIYLIVFQGWYGENQLTLTHLGIGSWSAVGLFNQKKGIGKGDSPAFLILVMIKNVLNTSNFVTKRASLVEGWW